MSKPWREIKQDFIIEVQKQVGNAEAESLFRIVFEHFTGQYSLQSELLDSSPTQEEYDKFQEIQARVLNHEPIQYILGETIFFDLPLRVNSSVLIPRQETEELVYWILQDSKKLEPLTVLDIGTGSGAIALALAKNLNQSTVWGIDISKEAIEIANQNKQLNQITNVTFQQQDMHDLKESSIRYDLIVSNPPYIDTKDKTLMEENVLAYEPDLALFAPENQPLYFYELIALFALNHLNENGVLYFEINEFYLDELIELLTNIGFQYLEPRKDLNGFWRMLKAKVN